MNELNHFIDFEIGWMTEMMMMLCGETRKKSREIGVGAILPHFSTQPHHHHLSTIQIILRSRHGRDHWVFCVGTRGKVIRTTLPIKEILP